MDKQTILKKILNKELRFDLLGKVIWKNRAKYLLPLAVVFLLSAIYIYSIPRYYRVTVVLAPEYNNSGGLGSLNSLKSVLGMQGSMSSEDAIQPLFYPEIINSTAFITRLFDAPIKTIDGTYEGTLRNYLTTGQKQPWWNSITYGIISLFSSNNKSSEGKTVDPFMLNQEETDIFKHIASLIQCSVDKKTDVITLTVEAQDPMVAALFAETVKNSLQEFITEYRTKKTRNDLTHTQKLCKKAYDNYIAKQKAYSSFSESNMDLSSPTFKIKEVDYENEMQQAYNTYTQLTQQLELIQAKLLARTPAFTTIQNTTVPIKPAGPKRMATILLALSIAFVGVTIFICSKEKAADYE